MTGPGVGGGSFLEATPESASELRAYCEKGRQGFAWIHDRLSQAAPELQFLIENWLQMQGIRGGRRKLMAVRVSRQLRHAASLQIAAAKAMTQCSVAMDRLIDEVMDAPRRGTGKAFDPETGRRARAGAGMGG